MKLREKIIEEVKKIKAEPLMKKAPTAIEFIEDIYPEVLDYISQEGRIAGLLSVLELIDEEENNTNTDTDQGMMYTIDIELTKNDFENKCLAYDFDPGELWEDLTVSITRRCNDEVALSKLPELLGKIFEWKVVSVKLTEEDNL